MKIALRLDDVAPGMDRERFSAFEALMDRYGVRPLVGAVPLCRDPKLEVSGPMDPGEYGQLLRSLQDKGWTVAMHGCYHVYTTGCGGLFPLNRQSEFAGLSPEDQEKLLYEGRQKLLSMGVETDLFMAPSHTYDAATLKALRETGFTSLTDGFGTMPYRRDGLTFYPISFRKSDCLKPGREGYTTFVYHPADLTEKGLSEMEKLIRGGMVISFDELRRTIPEERNGAGCRKEYLMARFKYTLMHLKH